MLDDNQNIPDGDNWDHRILCPDESCIGTIGPDGYCRECGLSLDGKTAAPAGTTGKNQEPAPAAAEDEIAEIDSDDMGGATENETDTVPDWDDRTLCRDESCIGTIGPDGCCNVCGLASNVDASAPDD
ncbi:MAG: hypothetical protein DSY90_15030 [Deltaproteobacteria bacterium]|nr:MAG: hypothetical protein DSY90_15030 [Deltaproteobacteria bacterium]